MSDIPYIYIDSSEPKYYKSKIEELGIPVKVEPLIIHNNIRTDYIIGDVLVERKSMRDFFNSLHSGRLFDQLYAIRETGQRGYLVVVGEIPKYDWRLKKPVSKKKYQYYHKTLRSMELRAYLSYGIGFVRVDDNKDFFKFILDMWNFSGRKPGMKVVPKKKLDITGIKSDIISRIPGFGRKMANALAKDFSIVDLVSIPVTELSNVKISGRRIGDKRAEQMKWVLNE